MNDDPVLSAKWSALTAQALQPDPLIVVRGQPTSPHSLALGKTESFAGYEADLDGDVYFIAIGRATLLWSAGLIGDEYVAPYHLVVTEYGEPGHRVITKALLGDGLTTCDVGTGLDEHVYVRVYALDAIDAFGNVSASSPVLEFRIPLDASTKDLTELPNSLRAVDLTNS